MDWKDVGKAVSKAAPILGDCRRPDRCRRWRRGLLIASCFGVGEDPAAIMTAIKADPDALVKIRKLNSSIRPSY